MAGGFGTQRDFGFDYFAESIVKEKIAVFLFDYRTFGGSDGFPRNLVSVSAHLRDWENAITFVVHNLTGVNNKKIGLWGASYSGGHTLVTAATHPDRNTIAAIFELGPFSDGILSLTGLVKQLGVSWLLSLTGPAIKDIIRGAFGLDRVYIPLYGKTGDSAIFTTPECYNGYGNMIPGKPLGGWQNKCPASASLEIPFYNPISYVQDIKSPVMLIYGLHDSLCPQAGMEALTSKLKNVTVLKRDMNHFNAYYSPNKEEISYSQTKFFKENLLQ